VLHQAATRPLPIGPSYLCEMLDLHGEPVLVLDLAKRLGQEHARPIEERKLVVIDCQGAPFAVCVDAVRDPEAISRERLSIGETFFFRHPEQFAFIGRTMVPEWIAARKQRINVWSAGCATGEEAYSLAACLLDLVPRHVEVSILATDLLERNLASAREGVYGAWSRRPSGPMLHPILEEKSSDSRMRIAPRLRGPVRFAQHNLLEPQNAGSFDLILCRNVLVYFSPESARKAVGHLVSALA